MTTKERKRPITAVTRNGKSCDNITFTFRKKFSSNRKYPVTNFATSCSCGTLTDTFELHGTDKLYLNWKINTNEEVKNLNEYRKNLINQK